MKVVFTKLLPQAIKILLRLVAFICAIGHITVVVDEDDESIQVKYIQRREKK